MTRHFHSLLVGAHLVERLKCESNGKVMLVVMEIVVMVIVVMVIAMVR